MSPSGPEVNLQIYDTPEIAAHYASLNYLTPCERLLFDSYIKPGGAILDLGVGGGRTTAYLASRSSHYVGVDYAPAMIRACQTKFPELEFKVAEASDLSAFSDASFDAVVFAFNGIDYVFPAEARRACLRHIHRALKPKGVLIFSSHNPRAILVRQRWSRDRLRSVARKFSGDSRLLGGLLLAGLTSVRFAWALGQSAAASVPRLLQRVPTRAFWRGEGDLVDSAHGGLFTHYWVPQRVIDEMNRMHFRIERVLGDEYPQASHQFMTDWYYYVFTKNSDRVS